MVENKRVITIGTDKGSSSSGRDAQVYEETKEQEGVLVGGCVCVCVCVCVCFHLSVGLSIALSVCQVYLSFLKLKVQKV